MAIAGLLQDYEERRITPDKIANIAELARNGPEPVGFGLAKPIISSLEEAPEEPVTSIQGDAWDPPSVHSS